MWNPFKFKPIIPADTQDFIIDAYAWLNKHFADDETKLILPTREFFPQVLSDEQQAAEATFNAIKAHAGMIEWPCVLVAQEPDVDALVAPTIAVQNTPQTPLGTFSVNSVKDDSDSSEQQIEITYNPAIASQPMILVSTLAHELAHYLTAGAPEPPPGGWESWEFVTDIAATFMGFGIFMANSATNFSQFRDVDSQGWKYSRSGYLSETEHVMVLAIFARIHQIEPSKVLGHLKSGLRPLFKKALKQVDKFELIDKLK